MLGFLKARPTGTEEELDVMTIAEDPTTGRVDAPLAPTLAHELRTPLTGLLGLLDLLVDSWSHFDSHELSEMLGMAHREAHLMAGLVENLLAAARIAHGTMQCDSRPLRIGDVVHDALALFPDVEKRAIVATPGDVWVSADPALVRQILVNLFQNITRYAPGGEVEVSVHAEDSTGRVVVSDDGPGMEEFPDAGTGSGLGLGLGLSRQLAALMGGALTLEPPLRKGTTIALSLPLCDPAEDGGSTTDILDPDRNVGVTPRARLLGDLTEALAHRSLDRSLVGLGNLAHDLLGTTASFLLVPDGSKLSAVGATASSPALDPSELGLSGHRRRATSTTRGWEWLGPCGIAEAIIEPVSTEGADAYLVLGGDAGRMPARLADGVAPALGRLAAVALDRATLATELATERRLRASVLEALPLAVSVFSGDPPKVVDWNEQERRLLGIDSDDERPAELAASQAKFNVRFADGTPLTLDNAPVVETIRTGRATGPFYLRVTRADGSEVITRTHCAPYLDHSGQVKGAIVTSEIIDDAELP